MKYLTPKEVEVAFDDTYLRTKGGLTFTEKDWLAMTDNLKSFIHQQRIQDLESEIEFCQSLLKEIPEEWKKTEGITIPTPLMARIEFNDGVMKIISHKQQLLQTLKK